MPWAAWCLETDAPLMPTIARWADFLPNLREHLVERMRDRSITLEDLNQLRLWIASDPKCLKAIGTRTSAPSRSAAKGDSPRPFWSKGRWPKAKRCEHR